MPIENRNLAVGTRLVATYKKQTRVCEVIQTDEGVRYKLADGRTYKSPSAAASAAMGGQAANGWRFWSVEGDGATTGERTTSEGQPPDDGEERAAAAPTAGKRGGQRIIKKVPNQQGTPEGQTRYFCAACAGSFYAATGAAPEACPQGHRAELDANGYLVTEPPVAVDETPAGDEPAVDETPAGDEPAVDEPPVGDERAADEASAPVEE